LKTFQGNLQSKHDQANVKIGELERQLLEAKAKEESAIKWHSAELTRRDADLLSLQQQNQSGLHALESRHRSEILGCETKILNLESQSRDREEVITKLNNEISELRAALSDQSEKARLEAEIARLKQSIADFEAKIQVMQGERSEIIARFKAQLDEKDAIIRQLRAQLKEFENSVRLRQLETALAEQAETLQRVSAELERCQSQPAIHDAGRVDTDALFSGILSRKEMTFRCDPGHSSSMWALPPLVGEEEKRAARERVVSSRRRKRISIDS
jgi:chromosome segregation ATPase